MPEFFFMEEEGSRLALHHAGGITKIDRPFKPYCFERGDGDLVDAYMHQPVKKREFETSSDVVSHSYSSPTFEADISYVRRVMLDMGWTIGKVPKAYIDIETDDSGGAPDMVRDPIVSIGIIFDDGRREFLYGDEEEILREFYKLTKDMGMIITYNGGTDVWESRSFDMPYIATRWGIVVEGMKPEPNCKFPYDKMMRHCMFLDVYQTYRYETSRIGKSLAGGMSLDNVAKHELGYGKVARTKKIKDHTREELEKYNMRDVEVLKKLDEKFNFSEMKIGMARLTNLPMVSWHNNKKRQELRPLIMVDNLLLKEARRLGYVLPSKKGVRGKEVVGALVLEPKVGLHKGIQNYDVKQMYPSIMINERVSPDKKREIIPNILVGLKEKRAKLKAKYNETKAVEDYIAQYNYKVLANVFYGATGNVMCRMYDSKLANYITDKGQRILKSIKSLCEGLGYEVVYGDTDSVFVKVSGNNRSDLERLINSAVAPYEIEAGEYYQNILFTGDEHTGRKKRYAGLTDDGEVKIVGLEAVRRDYCLLAREAQSKVLDMFLNGATVRDVRQYMAGIRRQLFAGELDDKLVISRGVKPLAEYNYAKGHKGLPHIRALRKANEMGYTEMFDIHFVFTTDDVMPIMGDADLKKAKIDYQRYWDRQVVAVCDGLLRSVMVGEGTYVPVQYMRGKRLRSRSQDLRSFISS